MVADDKQRKIKLFTDTAVITSNHVDETGQPFTTLFLLVIGKRN
jgi:hypothetical protein